MPESLWTPNSPTDVASGLQIVLPPGADRPKFWRCEDCGTRYPEEKYDSFTRHILGCARAHEGEHDEMVADYKSDIMGSDEHLEERAYKRKKAALKGVVGKGLGTAAHY